MLSIKIPKFDRDELEQLLAKLSAWVTETQPDGTDMVSIIDATQRVRCPLADIVKLILGGKLTQLCRNAEMSGLAAFRVNLSELRAALPQFEMPGVTKGDASRRLRVNYPTINFLIADGVLIERRLRNPRSRQFLDAVCSKSLTAFEAKFETLGQLSKRYRRASGPFSSHLEAKGICPIETPDGISLYYERKGLEGRLRRAGITPPLEEV
jgi:hypothetical protein